MAGPAAASVAFVKSVELAVVAAYEAAMAGGTITGEGLSTAAAFSAQHRSHGAALGRYTAGGEVANARLEAALQGQMRAATNVVSVVEALRKLELALASTYTDALATVTDPGALALMATVLPVEAQHAVVWASVLGASPAAGIPAFITADGGFDPSAYPVAAATGS